MSPECELIGTNDDGHIFKVTLGKAIVYVVIPFDEENEHFHTDYGQELETSKDNPVGLNFVTEGHYS